MEVISSSIYSEHTPTLRTIPPETQLSNNQTASVQNSRERHRLEKTCGAHRDAAKIKGASGFRKIKSKDRKQVFQTSKN